MNGRAKIDVIKFANAYIKKTMYSVLYCLYTVHVSEDTCQMNET